MDNSFFIMPLEMAKNRTVSVEGDIMTIRDGGGEIFLKDYIGNFTCFYNKVHISRHNDTHISILFTHRRLDAGDLFQISAYSSEYDEFSWFNNVFRFSQLAVPQMKSETQNNFWRGLRLALGSVNSAGAGTYIKYALGYLGIFFK